ELWGRALGPEDAPDRHCSSLRLLTIDGVAIPADQTPTAFTLREQREVTGEEVVIERPDGQRITALAYSSPLWDESGTLSGALNILVDISDRTRSYETQARLAAIIDSSDDAIISKSLDSTILSWNQGAQRLFGFSAEEAVGQSILMIIPPDRAGEEDMILSRLRAGERIGHYETVRLAKSGRRVDVSLTISPLRDPGDAVIGASSVARDITLEKRARDVLREADRIKDEFLAILAHELRNRLAPICSAV